MPVDEQAGSKTAGYVLGVVLFLPLVFLGLTFVAMPAFQGGRGSAIALLAVLAAAVGTDFAWLMRRRADRADAA